MEVHLHFDEIEHEDDVSPEATLIFAVIYTICAIINLFLTTCNIIDYKKSQDIQEQFGSLLSWYSAFNVILAFDWIAGGWYEYTSSIDPNITIFFCMGLGLIEVVCGTLAGFYEQCLFYYTYKNLKAKIPNPRAANIKPDWVLELFLKSLAIQVILLIIIVEYLSSETPDKCSLIWRPGFQSLQVVLQVILNGSFVTLNTYLYIDLTDLNKALPADFDQQVRRNVEHFCNYVVAVTCTIVLIGVCNIIAAIIPYWNMTTASTAVAHTFLVLIQALCVSFMRQGEADFGYTRRKIADKVFFWRHPRELGESREPLMGGEEAFEVNNQVNDQVDGQVKSQTNNQSNNSQANNMEVNVSI